MSHSEIAEEMKAIRSAIKRLEEFTLGAVNESRARRMVDTLIARLEGQARLKKPR